jgi:hypothetical protein
MIHDLGRQREMIEYDRHELGRTVQALADRMDVKTRGREALATVKGKARGVAREYRVTAAMGAAAGMLATGAVAVIGYAIRSARHPRA